MKIALVIASLGVGGAERVLANMANYWAARGHEVHLVIFASAETKSIYQLDERVKFQALDLPGSSSSALEAIKSNINRIRRIRAALRKLDVDAIISFMDRTNTLTLFAGKRLKTPIIVSDRANPGYPTIGRVWNALRSMSYPNAAAVVIQTSLFSPFYSGKIQPRIRIIPNPISNAVTSFVPDAGEERRKLVVGVGRLITLKCFHILIDAFAQVAREFNDWELEIYGEGPEREKLQRQIDESGLAARIRLMGVTTEPLKKMRAASIFVLSSNSEGMPNVLLEAMAMGCAPVASEVGNVSEIIREGEDGFIVAVDDIDGFAGALRKLISSSELRGQFGKQAASVAERFHEEKIMGMWEDLIKEVVQRNT